MLRSALILSIVSAAIAADCPNNTAGAATGVVCPATGSYNVCTGDSLQTDLIIRCLDGCPVVGRCSDNLAGYPPIGVKINALCYQDSPTAGNAACTVDCVPVTRADGSMFYPVGCTTQNIPRGGAAPSSSSAVGAAATSSGSASRSDIFGVSTITSTSTVAGSTATAARNVTASLSGAGNIQQYSTQTNVYTSTGVSGALSTYTSLATIALSNNPNAGVANEVQSLLAVAVAGLWALV